MSDWRKSPNSGRPRDGLAVPGSVADGGGASLSRTDEARFESESAPLRRERPDSLLRRKRFMAGGLAVEAWAVGEVLVEAERKAGQPAGREGGSASGCARRVWLGCGCGQTPRWSTAGGRRGSREEESGQRCDENERRERQPATTTTTTAARLPSLAHPPAPSQSHVGASHPVCQCVPLPPSPRRALGRPPTVELTPRSLSLLLQSARSSSSASSTVLLNGSPSHPSRSEPPPHIPLPCPASPPTTRSPRRPRPARRPENAVKVYRYSDDGRFFASVTNTTSVLLSLPSPPSSRSSPLALVRPQRPGPRRRNRRRREGVRGKGHPRHCLFPNRLSAPDLGAARCVPLSLVPPSSEVRLADPVLLRARSQARRRRAPTPQPARLGRRDGPGARLLLAKGVRGLVRPRPLCRRPSCARAPD